MLILAGECRYTLVGLAHLLSPRLPVVCCDFLGSAARISPATDLLVIATRYDPLSRLLPVFEKAIRRGVNRTALIGTTGQAVFLNNCGVFPDFVVPGSLPAGELHQHILGGLRRASPLQPSGRRTCVLTPCEREILQATLRGKPVEQIFVSTGISRKTLYAHRRNALGKLGVRTVRELLANACTGIPDSPESCARLLSDRTLAC